MKFRITGHSGSKPPDDAIDLLWTRLGPRREDTSFAKVGNEIRATWDDSHAWTGREEGVEIGRDAVLAILTDICERSPGLKSDWYAVSFLS